MSRVDWYTGSERSRRLLRLLVAGVVVAATVTSGVAGAAAAGNTGATSPTITEHTAYDRLPDERGRYAVTFEYDVPETVQRLSVRVPQLASDSVRAVSVTGFQRANETTFRYEGDGGPPSIRVAVTVPTDTFTEGSLGVETADWTFGYAPETSVEWFYRGDAPTFNETASVDGEGYARPAMFYAGPHDRATVRTDGADAVVVVPKAAVEHMRVSPETVRRLYGVALRDLDQGFQYDETGTFVLPPDRVKQPADGWTVGHSNWVTADTISPRNPENVAAHEYVHTRFGVFDGGSSEWLEEAAAEYYGHVLSVNAGIGNFSAFRNVAEGRKYAPDADPVTLTDARTVQQTDADYEKGAHVLAALDAEIQRRTGGERDLRDVFALRATGENDLETYDRFADAVVRVTGDESMRSWLDRYVAGEGLPPLPDDPRYFVLNDSIDSDADGLANGVELRADSNPFATDSDGDGVADGVERDSLGTDPASADTDGDGLRDGAERDAATDPASADTDGDGVSDSADASPTDAERATETTAATTAETTAATATQSEETTSSDASSPGFGVGAGAVAVAAAAVAAGRRRRTREN